MKLAVPAGERKPLIVTFAAPQQPRIGSLAALGLEETVLCTISGNLKGGVPAPKAASGRRIILDIQCQLCKK